jgi:hypothetical protein
LTLLAEPDGVEELVARLRADLYARQLSEGGWSFGLNSTQMALEPTCLALLALLSKAGNGARILIRCQHPDGDWGTFAGDDDASGLTGLALLTLNALGIDSDARSRAVRCLLRIRGREADWPWRWKFRWWDTYIRFNPGKFGWPWQPGTCSWVVPTAFAILALKKEFPCQRPRKVAHRIQTGIEMLLDRACPAGGWNAGNGVVYGTAMAPHIDATAIGLLAFQGERPADSTRHSLAWIEREAEVCEAPWSLAWSILALHVWRRPVESFQRRLACLAEADSLQDTATLAAVLLALDCTAPANPFKLP